MNPDEAIGNPRRASRCRSRLAAFCAAALCALVLAGGPARGQAANEVVLEPLAGEGLELPVGGSATATGDRVLVATLPGRVRLLVGGELLDEPLLALPERVTALEGEQGFYAVVPHPGFDANGRVVASFTEIGSGDLIVAEYRILPGAPFVSAESERELLRVVLPAPFHHGGALAFGPDGYLYATVGDGLLGDEDLPSPGRDLASLRGKVLRLDIDCGAPRDAASACPAGYAVPPDNPFVGVAGVRPEIFAYGLRNPWKLGFDPAAGRAYLADVGVDTWEEVNRLEAGADYGWPLWEGPRCAAQGCEAAPGTPPLWAYRHLQLDPEGGNAVVVGYVWRHPDAGRWQGRLLVADFVSGRLWALDPDARPVSARLLASGLVQPSGFVLGRDGALYLTTLVGGFYRLRDADLVGTGSDASTTNSRSNNR